MNAVKSKLSRPDLSTIQKAEQARWASKYETARKIYKILLKKRDLAIADRGDALLGLADVERIRGYFPEALRHYQEAEKLWHSLSPVSVVDAQVGWALAARASGQPRPALQKLWKALKYYQKEKDLEGEAFVHWALGGTLRIAGDMKKGLQELLIALRLFKKLKNSEGLSYTCCALGGIYRMLGDYAASGRYYREANRQMRHRGDTFGIAYSYCGLGNVERMAGRFKKALPFYKKAEKLYSTIGDRVSYAYTLWSLGTTYKMLGQYSQAHWAFHKADNLFKKTGDTRGRIYALLGHAEVEFLKNRQPKGISWWKQAKRVADSSHYVWEKLHAESLNGGRVKNLSVKYKRAGSSFYPKTLPVNWP